MAFLFFFILASKAATNFIETIYEHIGLTKDGIDAQLACQLSLKGLKFLFCNQPISLCTCKVLHTTISNYSKISSEKSSSTLADDECQAISILETIIPMSVIGLISEPNCNILEKISKVMDHMISYDTNQQDIFEALCNYETRKAIKDKVLHSMIPDVVGRCRCHVSNLYIFHIVFYGISHFLKKCYNYL